MAFKGKYPALADSRASLRGSKSMAVFGGSSLKQQGTPRDAAYLSPFMTFRPIPGIPSPPFPYFPPTGSGMVALKGDSGLLDRQRPAPPPFHRTKAKTPMDLLGRVPRPRPLDLLREDVENKMDQAFLSMPEDCQELVRMQVTQDLCLRRAMEDDDAIMDTKMKFLVAMLEWLGNLHNGEHFLTYAQRVLDVTLRYILSKRGF
ncbi:hypothetical protein CALCODRAFT_499933 [Calocera cornea HHB12733]|uniref:Uncharacterized protein n=1 Tax=Calocera cornea HHB12733 TaxID=1353952 RepID=A0A165E9V1_9BASI|nr:hypothetical protein CALCODRAFT_499933 [Calocera cornea HHB12733]